MGTVLTTILIIFLVAAFLIYAIVFLVAIHEAPRLTRKNIGISFLMAFLCIINVSGEILKKLGQLFIDVTDKAGDELSDRADS